MMKLIRPESKHKLRDIDLCIAVAKTRNYKDAARHYGLTKQRVSQIYRIYMAHLCEQIHGTPYAAAIKNRWHYHRKDALDMLYAYRAWVVENVANDTE